MRPDTADNLRRPATLPVLAYQLHRPHSATTMDIIDLVGDDFPLDEAQHDAESRKENATEVATPLPLMAEDVDMTPSRRVVSIASRARVRGARRLIHCITSGDVQAAEDLASLPTVNVNACDTIGFTAVMLAIKHGQLTVLDRLLQRNPDIQVFSGNQSALALAIAHDNPVFLERLCSRGGPGCLCKGW